ncbi:MAG: biopolymer transporter ExbD [Alphaproteobacteria bacterium]|nr:biopolymer transporter ExbD [Alphaproteobacteria bacterium]
MRRWDDERQERARVEIIPMIDVMMFLLVFFVLISINVIPALGLRTMLPQAAAPDDLEERKRVVITLAADGTIQLDGATVSLELLPTLLKQRRDEEGKDLSVTINGDQGATLQSLVSVFDVLKANGFSSVAIATERKAG